MKDKNNVEIQIGDLVKFNSMDFRKPTSIGKVTALVTDQFNVEIVVINNNGVFSRSPKYVTVLPIQEAMLYKLEN